MTEEQKQEGEFDSDLTPEQVYELGLSIPPEDVLTSEEHFLSPDAVRDICEAAQHFNTQVLRVLVSHGLAPSPTFNPVSDEEAAESTAASTYDQR